MTTISEFETLMTNNTSIVKWIDPNQDFIFYKFYTIYYITTDVSKDNIGLVQNTSICIFIKDRTLPTEVVYFLGVIPSVFQKVPITTFRDEINTNITAIKTANPTIEQVDIIIVDETNKKGLLYVYLYDSVNKVSTKKAVYVWNDGTFHYRVLTNLPNT